VSILAIAAVMASSCNASDAGGSNGMFSFLRGGSKATTIVHPAVGAELRAETAFPASASPPTDRSCRKVAVAGEPPKAALLPASQLEGNSLGFVVEQAGRAPLAIINVQGPQPRFELWELSADASRLVAQKTATVDPAQSSWHGFLTPQVGCLPHGKLLVAVTHYAPQVKEALYTYDLDSGMFSPIGRVAPNVADYDKFFEIQTVAEDSALVLYYTGRTRIAPERYYNAFNPVRLYSPRFPEGEDILKLGSERGNVVRFALVDKHLWLETTDYRDLGKPAKIWSLDLSKVL
jgi:hypothetical protein